MLLVAVVELDHAHQPAAGVHHEARIGLGIEAGRVVALPYGLQRDVGHPVVGDRGRLAQGRHSRTVGVRFNRLSTEPHRQVRHRELRDSHSASTAART